MRLHNNINKGIFVTFVFAFLLLIMVFTFFISYKDLHETLSLEREEYVSELTTQVVAKVDASISEENEKVTNYTNLMNLVCPGSFSELSNIYNPIKKADPIELILFVSDKGTVYKLDGSTIRVRDTEFIANIGASGELSSSFAPVGNMGDYWLFGGPINPIEIDDVKMVAMIQANKSNEFSEKMTVSMFDKQMTSFLISDSGTILLKPENAVGYGNNLLSSLVSRGMSDEVSAEISGKIKAHERQSLFFKIENDQWLLQTAPVQKKYSVALLLPVEITATETIKAMNKTMFLVGVMMVLLMAFILCEIMLLQKNTAEKRLAEERFKNELIVRSANNKTEFLSKMSHDIRTPLNGIIGMVYLASQNLGDRAALEDELSKIQSSADYLLSLVNDILDMSKIDSGKMEIHTVTGNIEEVLRDAHKQYAQIAQEKQITFHMTAPEKLEYSYEFDELRIRQILFNLLSNAMKFTPNGGTVELNMKVLEGENQTDRFQFKVIDTGQGMTREFMNRIFLPFEQESGSISQMSGGTGLGLSIVKSLVDLMNGTIHVDSQEGAGSSFTVSLMFPRREKIQIKETVEEKAKANVPKYTGQHVLLVEDHPINAQIAVKILSRWGLDVTVAENGKLGLETFEASEPGYYQMIFMDIQMPVMNGYDCSIGIRASEHPDAKTIPIYAMSANAFDEDVRKSLESGMNGHLRKPIEIPKVQEVLAKHLKGEHTE